MPIYLVETLVSYRIQYAIEAKSLNDAIDAVVWEEGTDAIPELSQKCLGEQVIQGRKLSKKALSDLIEQHGNDKDEMCSFWMNEQLIYKVNYENPTNE